MAATRTGVLITRAFRCRRAQAGFTLVELVMVLIIVGVLAVFVASAFTDSTTFRAVSFRDQFVAALRYAQKSAVSHRRLACATFTSTSVNLTIAAANPATTCSDPLNVPGGETNVVQSPNPAAITVTVSPVGPIYLQPSGNATSDGAGTTPITYSVTVDGLPAITIVGETGYVN